MKKLIVILAVVIMVSACAIQENSEGDYTTDIFTPIVQQYWTTKKESSPDNEIKRCTVYSSHNGVEVILQKTINTPLIQRVASSASMEPSTKLRVQVNNHFYRTAERSFSDKISAAIIEDFKTGDVAYIERSEFHPGRISTRRRASNIINLTNFNQMYNECLQEMSK
jgi:hypothetical protein